jgi:hypothetical protein
MAIRGDRGGLDLHSSSPLADTKFCLGLHPGFGKAIALSLARWGVGWHPNPACAAIGNLSF